MLIFNYSGVSVRSARKLFEYIECIWYPVILFLVILLGSNKFKYVAPGIAMNIWAVLSVQTWRAEVLMMDGLLIAGKIN